jgi:trehalose 6-phosphate synthase/phosphatase
MSIIPAERAAIDDGLQTTPPQALVDVLRQRRAQGPLRLLLDYDGTLVPIASTPELAVPDGELFALLGRLASSPGLSVALVSGRPRSTLEWWFGGLPVSLWADHGYWYRASTTAPWRPALPESPCWMDALRPVLDRFVAETPGSRLEPKTASIAWHYRNADPDWGPRQAEALVAILKTLEKRESVHVLLGKMVVEVRRRGISKALVAELLISEGLAPGRIVALGDDRTDQELFVKLPDGAVSVAVGPDITHAMFRLRDPAEVRQVLAAL